MTCSLASGMTDELILSVDLAARFSAAIVRYRASGEIVRQFDSRDMTHFAFAHQVAAWNGEAALTLIEDVPFGISSQAMVKPVLKFQGIIMAACHHEGREYLDRVRFIAPATWMRDYPGVQRPPRGLSKAAGDKARIEAARVHALAAGYEPPDLVQQHIDSLPKDGGVRLLRRDLAPLEKSMSDYVSAFLISEFARNHYDEIPTLQGVSGAYI